MLVGPGRAVCRGQGWGARAGLRLCCGTKLLEGLEGQSLFFPAPHPTSVDIARVTWRSWGTHIAEAKPREKMFAVNYLSDFRGRLLIHPTNLSLEIRPLKLGDSGKYEVVVDTLFDPTNPKTFSYLLLVHGESEDGGRRVVGTKLGSGPPRACPHGGGLPPRELPSPPIPRHPPLDHAEEPRMAVWSAEKFPFLFRCLRSPAAPSPRGTQTPWGAAPTAPSPDPPKVGAGPLSLKQPLAPRLRPCPAPAGGSPETATGTGDAGGRSGSTVGPRGASQPHAGDATTQGTGGGQPPGGSGGPGACGVRDGYCAVKGYLVAAVFGPLLILVATIHVMTRDKATEPGDEVSAGQGVGSEPPGITAVQGPYPWQR
ncbi:hypothetical protein QYF61_023634 [Mycteria americana]|uniref:Uncharacterized protein n=1 Tax=Mycteria americana TaxID=33587 RepID=A0AAN7NAH3_MYCAM|nr:hypothetical protein QYF61_023634 [Mycteria americana]